MLFPQSPCIELYNASSNDTMQLWKMKGKIKKEFEPYTKSYYHILLTGGVSSLLLPTQEKQMLQMSNLFLLFQFVLMNHKSFLIELNVRDYTNAKKILKITLDNNYPLNIWTNLLIDTSNIFQQTHPNFQLKYIDAILITGNIKLRKIYSLKTKEEDLPKSLDLGKSLLLQNFFYRNIREGLEKIDVKFSEHCNKKNNNNPNYNTPLKPGKNSHFKTENKNNLNLLNEKTKNNIKFGNKIPKIDRLKNEIIYGLKVNQDGNLETRDINKILGFKALDDIENMNKKERERSLGKGSLQKEINNNVKRNKNKSLNYKINHHNYEKDENIQKKSNEKNINKNISKENNNGNNKIVFHNDTLYNFGNNKTKNAEQKYLSYGVSSPYEKKDKIENNKIKAKNDILLQKMDKDNINYPISKDINENNQQDNNITNNNKYGNFEIMLDSALMNNSKLQAQLYDSIEEDPCLVNNINNTIDGSKLDEKIIKLDPEYSKINGTNLIIKNDLENSEFPEISNLINENKEHNRPYTPQITELAPINQSEIIEEKEKSNDKNHNMNNISYTKIIKDTDELIFDEIKRCYYNPKTNIYYDIKDVI
jgi:hypothetical protein